MVYIVMACGKVMHPARSRSYCKNHIRTCGFPGGCHEVFRYSFPPKREIRYRAVSK